MPTPVKKVKVEINWVPFWWKVAYLIVQGLDKERAELARILEAHPSEAFQRFVQGHVEAYVQKGTAPPAAIATAILNLADDHLAGRELTMRAGDYIALQQFHRAKA